MQKIQLNVKPQASNIFQYSKNLLLYFKKFLKRDIDFSIDLVHEATPISKGPYKIGSLELKELQMQVE